MSEFVAEAGYDTASMIYDPSGAVFRRLWTDRSGGHFAKVITNFVNPLTYYTNTIQDLRSGAYLFACFNSGVQQNMEMKALYTSYVNPLITSGVANVPLLELWRITAISGGGSGQALLRADPGDTLSGIAVQHNINNLSGAGGTDKLLQWSLGNQVSGTGGGVSSLSAVNFLVGVTQTNMTINAINQIPAQSREMKQPMIRSGYGLAVRQSVNAGYTQVISGQIFLNAIWVVSNSGDITTY